MKRTAELKRTGFRRPERSPRAEQRFQPIPLELRKRISTGPAVLRAAPKNPPVRHEGYRRLVASMPCAWCGIAGFSQAAHANAGKALAMKTDDRTCFALCGPRTGDPGCHHLFDAGGVLKQAARRLLETSWGEQTRLTIRMRGLWPADLPPWPEDDK